MATTITRHRYTVVLRECSTEGKITSMRLLAQSPKDALDIAIRKIHGKRAEWRGDLPGLPQFGRVTKPAKGGGLDFVTDRLRAEVVDGYV